LRPLQEHPATRHPDLVVGLSTSDDAGVYRLAPSNVLLVHTVDFFTPIVDDPYDWGRIAAANSLSDIYAMGARPIIALQLVGWPRDLGFELLAEVLRGGADTMARAGTTIVGGHSIDDGEPKYGFSVTGTAEEVVTNSGALPGDELFLTKALGTGVVSTALKAGDCPDASLEAAVEAMCELNDRASAAMLEAGVRCATDVTGFGLLGHLLEILNASKVGARLRSDAVPALEGVMELLDRGHYPGGSQRNLDTARPHIKGAVETPLLKLLADAQTSGGLLMAVPHSRAGDLAASLETRGVTFSRIGEITDGDGIDIQ